ncbi:hypothetical protein RJ639_021552 [Escallonia herrerae]|uniref:Uncharacterized protein n=1 Tax=Escallonia herrerae TaxID=1293975 RepID=A0AA88V2P1_9ASTE|nr:hypothetical protein RJ639_021552 [Escallonia herrerae]
MALGDLFPNLRWLTSLGVARKSRRVHGKGDVLMQGLIDSHRENGSYSSIMEGGIEGEKRQTIIVTVACRYLDNADSRNRNNNTDYGISSLFLVSHPGQRLCPEASPAMKLTGLAMGTLIQCSDWETEAGLDMAKNKPSEIIFCTRQTLISALSQL